MKKSEFSRFLPEKHPKNIEKAAILPLFFDPHAQICKFIAHNYTKNLNYPSLSPCADF
jgi:hypothetical protein